MRMVQSQGVWIHARADGLEHGAPLLLVNSLGTDLRMWDKVVEALGGRFRIIRFDKPGHGLSESCGRPARISDFSAHAFAVLDAFGIRQADVAGISIGGQIAIEMMTGQPNRIGRLVLSNTAARIGSADMWQTRIASLEKTGLAAMADSILERWFPASYREADLGQMAACRSMLMRCDLPSYLACCDALATSDLSESCRRVSKPVLVIGGTEDLATPPATVAATAALIPGARAEMLKGAGHLPPIDSTATFVNQVQGFLIG